MKIGNWTERKDRGGSEPVPRMRPIVGVGSVVRVVGGKQMGIQLDQLSVAESERLQEFLLPLIPIE